MRRIGEVTKERDFWVHSYHMPPKTNTCEKMEVGIEDCLHIEFEFNKPKWDPAASEHQADSPDTI